MRRASPPPPPPFQGQNSVCSPTQKTRLESAPRPGSERCVIIDQRVQKVCSHLLWTGLFFLLDTDMNETLISRLDLVVGTGPSGVYV